MSATIEKQINESLRDAQLGYFLSAIVPQDETLVSRQLSDQLKTPNDLYHYWLLDVLVSQDVSTSPVASAVSGLQQYINSILTTLEPGYHSTRFAPDLVEAWNTVNRQYSTWAANQQLYYFPACYLDPALRPRKTDNFAQLENDLNRNHLTEESVQTAVLGYLTRLEEVANLEIINGYIDGNDFANDTYYFIARSRASDTWYWRSLDMSCRPKVPGSATAKYDAPAPQAWSEWQRVNVSFPDTTVRHTIRPVIFNKRLYVIWAEVVLANKTTHKTKKEVEVLFRLNMSFKKLDGSWNTPSLCAQYAHPPGLIEKQELSTLLECTTTVATRHQASDSMQVALYMIRPVAETQGAIDFHLSATISKDAQIATAHGESAELITAADIVNLKKLTSHGALQFSAPPHISGNKPPPLAEAPKVSFYQDAKLGRTEFIDFDSSAIKDSDGQQDQPRSPVRMNINFARHLIARAEASMDELLDWSSQHLQEPPFKTEGASEHLDFYGSYGRYFIELFLYLPWLVAQRFNQERQYNEAKRWLEYLFDPGKKKEHDEPAYWKAVPLINDTPKAGQSSYAIEEPQDPHQIALSHPVHFRKALYMLYIDILLNRGDSAYRTQTPDSLTEAKLWYIHAEDLLGPRPDIKQTDLWNAIKLHEFSTATNEALRKLESTLTAELDKTHEFKSHQPAPRLTILRSSSSPSPSPSLLAIDTAHLRLPFHPMLLPRWEKLESRLHNLRHNLDITGRPMMLPLFAEPADPQDLLGARGERAAEPGTFARPSKDIPPYRFSALHALATNAADTVIQFGATLLSFIERGEQASFQELQQQHIRDIANIAVDLQTQSLKIDQKATDALLASKAIVEQRRDHFSQLVDEVFNTEEVTAGVLHLAARTGEVAGLVAEAVGQGLKVGPNSAFGGFRLEGGPFAARAVAQGIATMALATGEALDRSAQYRRRHQDWTLARDQAVLEIAYIDAQLKLEIEKEKAAQLALRQTQTALSQALASYDFLSKRFSNSQLYQWFTYQLSSFYYQAYDLTFSLCQLAEQSWRYEKADSITPAFFQHPTWNSTYRGYGPGERMKMGLLKLQSGYLLDNERELEIRKTVRLRTLNTPVPVDGQQQPSLNKPWDDTSDPVRKITFDGIKSDLLKRGYCEFELSQELFDNDYPSHYLRRIKSISVSLPAVLGPYEDIRATLTQTASEVVMGGDSSVLKNQRASQHIALSTGIDDHGLFTLNFQDDRYLPFEYTGAVSKWKLAFPNHEKQQTMLASLTDIIVHVQYTARDGGTR